MKKILSFMTLLCLSIESSGLGQNFQNMELSSSEELFKAIDKKDIGKIKSLLKNIDNIDAKDKYEYTALCRAFEIDSKEIVKLLLDKGANIEAKDKYGKTLLQVSASNGEKDMVELLLDSGANIGAQDENGNTALHTAKNESIVSFLIADGANINMKNNIGHTALHYHINNFNISKILIKHGASVTNEHNYGRTTALCSVVMNNNYNMTKLLLENGIDINESLNKRALFHAVKKESDESIVKLLLEYGADANENNPLHIAINNGNIPISTMLLEHGANVIGLSTAVAKQNEPMVRLLIKYGADVNEAIHTAANTYIYGDDVITKILLENGANIKIEDIDIHSSASNGQNSIIKIFVDNKGYIDKRDKSEKTALQIVSARSDRESTVQCLLDNGANPNASGCIALHEAIYRNYELTVKHLLEYGANVDAKDENGNTALHVTSYTGKYAPIVSLLLEHGADVSIQNKDEKTPLQIAYGNHWNEPIFNILIKHIINGNSTNEDKEKFLHMAIERNYESVVEMLIGFRVDINAKDENGRTPIQIAKHCNNPIIKMLIDNGADIKIDDINIHSAARNGQKCLVQIFIDRGGDVNTKDENGETVFQIAKYNCDSHDYEYGKTDDLINNEAIVNLLLENGAENIYTEYSPNYDYEDYGSYY